MYANNNLRSLYPIPFVGKNNENVFLLLEPKSKCVWALDAAGNPFEAIAGVMH